ncbi:MAG: Zn-dependent oligopeptidase [Fidelibacterota bacterium]|nr:MAG: Zn-dependent oligopeptidase [Candidatus Neomarinimicrobiota bacterium]
MLRHFALMALAMTVFYCAGPRTGDRTVDSQEVTTYQETWKAELAEAQDILEQLETLEGPGTVETVLEPLNDLLMIVITGVSSANLQANVHPDPAMRSAAEEAQQVFSNLNTDIGLSRPIYEAVAGLDVSGETADTRRFVELILRDYRRSGVDKDEETRERIRQLQEELVGISQEFGRNIREDVRSIQLAGTEDLDGLPQDYIDTHQPGEDGVITITTDYPEFYPYMTYAHSELRRKGLYQAFLQRAYPQNLDVLDRMMDRRYELANLLGYPTWADFVTEIQMIRTPQATQTFVDQLTEAARPALERDMALLLERLKQIDPQAASIGIWQRYYLPELISRETYDFDSQETRPYFAYDKVRDGLLTLTSRMFGVTYTRLEETAWHPSVEIYQLWSGDDLLGKFYLDMHPREGKFKHGGMFRIAPGVDARQLPQAAIVCNFPGGENDQPGFMGHNQVRTFFHEFGHLLQTLFSGHHRWISLSGIAEFDFVEVPSTIMEEWTWDLASLHTFATNADGEPIPEELVSRMQASRMFAYALWIQRQVALSAIALNFYNRDPLDVNTTTLLKEVQDRYNPYLYMDDTCLQCNFSHLSGYSALYYTYMWSMVIARDLFSEFEKGGLLNPEVAMRFRESVLEPGALKSGTELVRDFLGRDYSFKAFEVWLKGD